MPTIAFRLGQIPRERMFSFSSSAFHHPHAGIINILREAQQLTEESQVHAVIGEFHLARGVTKDAMQETVKMMKKIRPKLLVFCHCTGWRARHMMSAEMPDEYVEGSVGHKYIISKGDVS